MEVKGAQPRVAVLLKANGPELQTSGRRAVLFS
jgi:hypothetical protein